jgi:cation:H+ antiporter
MLTEILLYSGILILSILSLLKGSDWFVNAGETIGSAFGIPSFVIGVTIIAFGTSLPELASSIAAVNAGEPGIVVGNVVGSNITNIALILGIVAILGGSIVLEKEIRHVDIPILLGSSFMLWFVARDQSVSIIDAILLLLGLFIFLAYSFGDSNTEDLTDVPKAKWNHYGLLVLGVGAVYLGAEWTIFSIEKLSAIAQINPDVIALSIVALGTSLPELIVSVTAARTGRTEIAVGNVIGSNIFNIYAVMSIPRFFGPITISQDNLDFSLPFMLAVTLLLAFMCIPKRISKWEGWVFLLFYALFIAELTKDIFN